MPTPHDILEGLKTIKYPGYTRDIVSFGIVKDIEVASAGVTVTLSITAQKRETVDDIVRAVSDQVATSTGLPVEIVVQAPEVPQQPRGPRGQQGIPGVRHIVAVASGKGGVGKSTVATNVALALGRLGHRVGLLDADVYGPSVPLMLGIRERPEADDHERIRPIERLGLKVISMGLFVADGTPVIWRGPMLNKLLTQFLRDVEWGELDFLVLDLPPGTGDAQLTILQQVALSGGVIVTTPQDVALLDVRRGVTMFNQVNAPVLGVIENMSYHVCRGCGHRAEIFGHGGGAAMAAEFGVPLLGEIPLVGAIREAGDAGTPIVAADPESPQALAFVEVAKRIAAEAQEKTAAALPVIH
jgi:ATP-binding protein involved in chromosome partitioning